VCRRSVRETCPAQHHSDVSAADGERSGVCKVWRSVQTGLPGSAVGLL
jgi:hypothetical protein